MKIFYRDIEKYFGAKNCTLQTLNFGVYAGSLPTLHILAQNVQPLGKLVFGEIEDQKFV